jgi:hypothetical protein
MDLKEIGWEGVDELDSFGSGYGPVVGSYEHCNKHLGSIKGGKLLN